MVKSIANVEQRQQLAGPPSGHLLPLFLSGVGILAILTIVGMGIEIVQLRQVLSSGATSTQGRPGLMPGDHLSLGEFVTPATGTVATLELRDPTVLYFFTTTCPFCDSSYPEVNRLYETLGGDASFVGIALDGPAPAVNYMASDPPRWPLVAPPDRASSSALGIPAVPAILLVDTAGVIIKSWWGFVEAATVDEVVAASAGRHRRQ